MSSKPALEQIDTVYKELYRDNQRYLGHYIHNLCALLEFVASSSIENPDLYSNVVRAQLSTGELLLLFYIGLSALGQNKFKPLIERFSLLEGLDKEAVPNPTHLELYKPQAYGRQQTDRAN
jgi:hypothetical protein